jgi:tetratricopeptide (TPR) repeat protein
MQELISKIEQYIADPDEPLNSFELGYQYELMGHMASAMGYYLKCAELTDETKVAYECLLRKAICLEALKDRNAHVRNSCLLAIGLMPERPEAYHLLTISYERAGLWQESYAWSRTGQRLNGVPKNDRIPNVNYEGYYTLPFQEAVALWWLGRFDESLTKFKEVQKLDGISPTYIGHCQWNIDNLEGKDADKLASQSENSTTDKEEIIKKILAKRENKKDA